MTADMLDLKQIFAPLESLDLELTESQQVVALGLYRELAKGAPVRPEQIASASGIPTRDVVAALDSTALSCLTFHDDQNRVVGFGGLAVPQMAHKFIVGGKELYTWCAWDALFIPELLDATARVESTCPETKSPVRLEVAPDGVKMVEPVATVVSFLLPDELRIEQTAAETMKTFCHRVHFLASPAAGQAWTDRHPGTFVLSLEDAFALAQMLNSRRFPSVLQRTSS
jgi:alkylmercury lyase